MPAPLLHHALLPAAEGEAKRYLLFLHGILGSGANWRTFAKRLLEELPGWGAVLVDLRMHGRSLDLPPPHTLASAAADLAALSAAIPGPVEAVIGHSFGAKVALTYASIYAQGEQPAGLRRLFLLDSPPGTGSLDESGSGEVLALLEGAPFPFPSREAFVRYVVEAGYDRPMAAWLAMSLRREGQVYRYRLDLPAVRALLEDFFRHDLWPFLAGHPKNIRINIVIGEKSTAISDIDRQKFEAIRGPRLRLHELPGAGHWLHVDDPEGLLRYLCMAMGESEDDRG